MEALQDGVPVNRPNDASQSEHKQSVINCPCPVLSETGQPAEICIGPRGVGIEYLLSLKCFRVHVITVFLGFQLAKANCTRIHSVPDTGHFIVPHQKVYAYALGTSAICFVYPSLVEIKPNRDANCQGKECTQTNAQTDSPSQKVTRLLIGTLHMCFVLSILCHGIIVASCIQLCLVLKRQTGGRRGSAGRRGRRGGAPTCRVRRASGGGRSGLGRQLRSWRRGPWRGRGTCGRGCCSGSRSRGTPGSCRRRACSKA